MHNYVFPPFYASWLAERIPKGILEDQINCDQCSMVKPLGKTRDQGPFLANLKCCTYFPYLPNFTLGALSTEKFMIAKKRGILLPVGLYPGEEYQMRSEQFAAPTFGQEPSLLCPFYDNSENHCGIWQFRPGVCTSYFCKSNKGAKGLLQWSKIESYLNHFEWQFANYIVSQLNFDENSHSFARAALDLEIDTEERIIFLKSAWGTWFEKEQEFYQKALALALTVQSKELDKILEKSFLDFEKDLNNKLNKEENRTLK